MDLQENGSLVSVGEFYSDRDPNELETERLSHEERTRIAFPGPKYIDWLEWFHKKLKPKTYVEIGVESGYSLQLAQPLTRVIGIDPSPKLEHGMRAWTKVFKMESDRFFNEEDLLHELRRKRIRLSFIDGLHHYDQALRDFLNIEFYSKKSTIILLHDVHPAIPETATRERTTKYWAGDTWKIMHILANHRPDLTMYTIPTYPTSLGLITNLNPYNSVSNTELGEMIAEVSGLIFDVNKPINPVENDFIKVEKLLGL